MKISYKNTALGLLENMDVHSFRIIDDDGETSISDKSAMAISIIQKWPQLSEAFKQKKQYISDPFYEAYDRGVHKLAGVIDHEPLDQSGTFIYRVTPGETNTIFYSIKTFGSGSLFEMDATVLFFSKQHHKDKPSLGLVVQRRPGMPSGGARWYASQKAIKAGLTATSVIADILGLILFLKYCDLEIKTVRGNKKENHVGVKYVNETKQDIEILDSTWFTTLVKSDGFKVRGHFRFQPYGPNNSLRKLIWISDFEKDGYTRAAKVLTQKPE